MFSIGLKYYHIFFYILLNLGSFYSCFQSMFSVVKRKEPMDELNAIFVY